MTDLDKTHFRRRELLFGAGALGGASLFGGVANAAAGAPLAALPGPDPATLSLLQGGCVVTGSDVQGPFHLNLNLLRKDITEGSPGFPMTLYLKIKSAATCSPIANAVVDVWQTDAAGDYSGFASRGTQGQTFLRGIQITPASGLVCFDTIFPSWYSGRTPHIHVQVRPDAGTELTTQLYLPQVAINQVLTLPPYDILGPATTTNSTDFFYEQDRELRLRRAPNGNGIVAGKTIIVA